MRVAALPLLYNRVATLVARVDLHIVLGALFLLT